MRNLKAIKTCTLLGVAAGALAWVLLRGYLWGSDNAWFTGSPGPMGQDMRAYINHKYDLAEPYWQLPFAITLLGTAVGTLVAVLRVNLTIIWQAIAFTCRAFIANWGWALALFVLPLLGSCLAAFFTGQRQQYEAPASAFRLSWSNPGALAICICSVFFVLPLAVDLITGRNPTVILALVSLAFVVIGFFLDQISAGIWLERAKTLAEIKRISLRSCRLRRIRDVLAMNFFIYFILGCAIVAIAEMFFWFLMFETPQLEVNMQNTGMPKPVVFSALVTGGRYLASYWYFVLITPFIVFFSLCNAKLWISFEDQDPLPPQNSP
jgi:hypothetical protein